MSDQEKTQKELYEDAVALVQQQLVAEYAMKAGADNMNTELVNVINAVAVGFKYQLAEIEKRIAAQEASIFLPHRAAVVSFDNWARMEEDDTVAYLVRDNDLKQQFSLCVLGLRDHARSNYLQARSSGDKKQTQSLGVAGTFSNALLEQLPLNTGKDATSGVTAISRLIGRYDRH